MAEVDNGLKLLGLAPTAPGKPFKGNRTFLEVPEALGGLFPGSVACPSPLDLDKETLGDPPSLLS